MVRFPDGSLSIATVEAIADVLQVSPKFLYYLSNNVGKHYRITKIPKKNGKFRTIEAPDVCLKHVQRMILDKLLPQSVGEIATAFEPGKGLLDNVVQHAGNPVVLALDLKDFFPSLRLHRIVRVLRELDFPRASAVLLAKLCTLNGHLPQGAPTSPHLANLAMHAFDDRLYLLCGQKNLAVTRYADDITISGNIDRHCAESLIASCRVMLKEIGLRINYRKLRILRQNARQEVTGVVVNEKPSVPRHIRRELRKKMYYLRRYGVVGYEPVTLEALRSLLGSVMFVNYVDPDNFEFRQYAEELKIRIKECA